MPADSSLIQNYVPHNNKNGTVGEAKISSGEIMDDAGVPDIDIDSLCLISL